MAKVSKAEFWNMIGEGLSNKPRTNWSKDIEPYTPGSDLILVNKWDVEAAIRKAESKKTLSEWQTEVHNLAKEKGWYDKGGRSDVETISLIICEAAEAIEQIRNEKPSYYEVEGKPEGASVEIADCVIRCLDLAESRGWNLEEIIKKKHEYNKTREYKHGKKL